MSHLTIALKIKNMRSNPLEEKTFELAVRSVLLAKFIKDEYRDFDLASQLRRSGAAPGALYREARQAESKRDFIHKLGIGLKEADEVLYWLKVLKATDYISKEQHDHVAGVAIEVFKILTASIKTTKARLHNNK